MATEVRRLNQQTLATIPDCLGELRVLLTPPP